LDEWGVIRNAQVGWMVVGEWGRIYIAGRAQVKLKNQLGRAVLSP